MMICKLSNDVLFIIYKKYIKNFNLYYCNLGLVSKKMYNLLVMLFKNIKFMKFRLPYNYINKFRKLKDKNYPYIMNNKFVSKLDEYKLNSIYYVRSKKYNINLAKIYFSKTKLYNFGLIYGDEGLLFSIIKNMNKGKNIELLRDFEYIII